MNVIGGPTMFGSDKRIRQRANAIAKLPGRAIGGAFNALILPIRKPVIEVVREVEIIRERSSTG